MDYSKMSDYEVNKAVAKTLGIRPRREINFTPFRSGKDIFPDYCNRPDEAWPIIDENNISIINDNPSHRCAVASVSAFFNGTNGCEIKAHHANGLRAAMIVYLQMQDSANVPANSTGSDIR